MKSTARISDHPIHPMLIPYPFAFLSGALGFRLAARARQSDTLATTADHLRTAGLASAVVAAVPGLIDYLTVVPDGRPKTTATQHLVSNSSALVCFLAAAIAGRRHRHSDAVMRFELAGTALLCLGGYLGGSLSYKHHIGVVEAETRRQQPLPAAGSRMESAEMAHNVGP